VTDDAGAEEVDITIAATSGGAVQVLDEGGSLTAAVSSLNFVGSEVVATNVGSAVTVTVNPIAPLAHQVSHQSGGSDALTGLVDATARAQYAKNSGAVVSTRRQLNVIEGANVTVTLADDGANERANATIGVTGVELTANKGAVSGYAPLDAAQRLPVANLTLHQATHQSGGADALSGNLDATARINVSKNSGATVGTRRRLNLIEGTNITLTVADDAGNEEVDVTITGATPPTITVKDEGVNLTTAVTSFDFTGAGVTASVVGNAVTVNVPGGGGGGATALTFLADTGLAAAASKTVVLTDASFQTTSKLLFTWGNVLDTDVNSPEWDDVSFFATPAAGSCTLRVSATQVGHTVHGSYRVNCLVG
jgi:hypothetical protein